MDLYISLCFNATTRDVVATALNISTTDIDDQLCFVPCASSIADDVIDALAYSVIAEGVLALLFLILVLVLAIALCCVAKKLKRQEYWNS